MPTFTPAAAAVEIHATGDTTYLPYLGVHVPKMPFTLGPVRTWRGREGDGTQVTIKQGKTRLGDITDDGNGGGEWFSPSAPGGYAVFRDYVAQFAGLAYDLYGTSDDPGIGGEIMLLGTTDDGKGHDEDVCSILTAEALFRKKAKSVSRNGVMFLVGNEKPGRGYRQLSGGPDSPSAREYLAREFPNDKVLIWNEPTEAWVTA